MGAILFGILVLLFIVGRVTGAAINPATLRAALAPLGIAAPFGFVIALAGVLVIPIIPASIFQIAAGMVFGPFAGLFWALAADWIGASVGFWLARLWGRQITTRVLSSSEQSNLHALAERMDWRVVVLLRLVPGPAYPLVSMAAGYASLSYVEFISASLAGVFPALVLLVFAGDLAEDSPIIAVLLVVAVVVSVVVAGRLLNAKGKGGNR